MASNNSSQKKGQKHISAQLLLVLIPMVAAALVILTVFISVRAKSVIEQEATSGLYQESRANAADIAQMIEGIKKYYDGTADLLESSPYVTDADIFKALEPGMSEYSGVVIDSYLALGKDAFYDGGGWVPDSDYDPTTRAWYINGSSSTSITLGDPSVDMTTGQMVVCGSRSVKMLDGRSGVLSTDIVLQGISDTVSAYTPSGTGNSMLVGGGVIIGHVNSSIFKGVHYELKVEIENKEYKVHTYEDVKPGDNVGLKVDPYEICLMKVDGTCKKIVPIE